MKIIQIVYRHIALLGAISTLAIVANSSAMAALVNGDFESGNTGFGSQYSFAVSNTTEGEYTVRSDPQNWNGAFNAMPDHTSGSGNMMVINGSTLSNLFVWEQTVSVNANTLYDFSAWVSTAVAGGPAELILKINDVTLGTSFLASSSVGTWDNWTQSWQSGGTTTAKLSIFDINTSRFPNDFYLDDISFDVSPIPVPAAVWLFATALLGLIGYGKHRKAAWL